jgi:hypothetical protein
MNDKDNESSFRDRQDIGDIRLSGIILSTLCLVTD